MATSQDIDITLQHTNFRLKEIATLSRQLNDEREQLELKTRELMEEKMTSVEQQYEIHLQELIEKLKTLEDRI